MRRINIASLLSGHNIFECITNMKEHKLFIFTNFRLDGTKVINLIEFFIVLQASQEVSVPHVNTSTTVVINVGLTKTTKKLTWEHVGRPIHSVVLHTQKASFLKKCKCPKGVVNNIKVSSNSEKMCSTTVLVHWRRTSVRRQKCAQFDVSQYKLVLLTVIASITGVYCEMLICKFIRTLSIFWRIFDIFS